MSNRIEDVGHSNHIYKTPEKPIVIFDGLLMRCVTCQQKFVPESSLTFDDLIESLRNRLSNPKSPRHQHESRWIRASPIYMQNAHYKAYDKSRKRSDEETSSEEELCCIPVSPTKQKTSSNEVIPNSVLLQIAPQTFKEHDEDAQHTSQQLDDEFQNIKSKLQDQIDWVRERGEDYVALETFNNIKEIAALIRLFMESKIPAALGFKINQNRTVTVSYQFLHNFKKDFMMIEIGKNCRVFMPPF